ncbi:unnamed protein product, partial [Urochloa humidicola]
NLSSPLHATPAAFRSPTVPLDGDAPAPTRPSTQRRCSSASPTLGWRAPAALPPWCRAAAGSQRAAGDARAAGAAAGGRGGAPRAAAGGQGLLPQSRHGSSPSMPSIKGPGSVSPQSPSGGIAARPCGSRSGTAAPSSAHWGHGSSLERTVPTSLTEPLYLLEDEDGRGEHEEDDGVCADGDHYRLTLVATHLGELRRGQPWLPAPGSLLLNLRRLDACWTPLPHTLHTAIHQR